MARRTGVVLEKRLDAASRGRRVQVVAGAVEPGDGDELGLEALAEDARRAVAVDAGERPAAQRPIDVDVAVGDELGAGADGGHHDQVAAVGEDALARADRLGDEERCGGLRGGGHGLHLGGGAAGAALERGLAAALEGDEAGTEGGDALLGRRALDADGEELAGTEGADELHELGLVLDLAGVLEVENERGVDEEVRRLAHKRVERLEEAGVRRAREAQHHGRERPATHLQRSRGDANLSPRLRIHGLHGRACITAATSRADVSCTPSYCVSAPLQPQDRSLLK